MSKNSLVTHDMKVKYLQRRQEELALCNEKLKLKDFDYLKNMGHQIKGNASTFEFPELTEFGVSLEQMAGEKNFEAVVGIIGGLKLAVQGLVDRMKLES